VSCVGPSADFPSRLVRIGEVIRLLRSNLLRLLLLLVVLALATAGCGGHGY
jgi:hypothetical protein